MAGKIINSFFKKAKRALTSKYAKFNMSLVQEKFYKHAANHKKYIHKYKKGIKVAFTDPLSFLHAIKEIFVDEIYLFETTNATPFIIDCGGYIGISALFFKLNYPHSKIIAFEPDSGNFSLAKQNIDSWGFQDIELFKKAVWINDGELEFYESNSMASSVHAMNTGGNRVKVSAVRLKDFLDQKVDFLKIDIEGAEYEVLLDIKSRLVNVEKMFVEYHGYYDEMNKLNSILNILTEENFKWYIKEAENVYSRPFYDKKMIDTYDVQLNIFAFKNGNK
ncbi:MAG TPA: FkbM family methyltransferase [Hanamia sp.]|jgi:FkbM family methyltransferase|nr:FkbM family methyltransferase [Hanamia sp.]